MNILMGFDHNYAMPAAVAIRSLGESLLPEESATIHVLGVGLTEDDRERIEMSAPSSLSLLWYEFDPQDISDLPMSSIKGELYISQTAYALLFLDRYLPEDVSRVLFVDADVLVRRSPAELFDLNLGGRPLAGVQDFGCPAVGMPTGVAGWRDLGLDGRLPCMNTGLLLIDRATWRKKEIEARSLDYLSKYHSQIHYADQDTINATNAGDWLELAPIWNYQALLEWALGAEKSVTFAFIDLERIEEARRNPAIVHYAGSLKPWHYEGSDLPFVAEWNAVFDETPWGGTRPAPPDPIPVWKKVRFRGKHAIRALRGAR